MFHKNKIKIPKIKTIEVVYDNYANNVNCDEPNVNKTFNMCINGYNYYGSSGNLKNGYGFRLIEFPVSTSSNVKRTLLLPNKTIEKVWHYRNYDNDLHRRLHKIMFNTSDGNIYYYNIFSNYGNYYCITDDIEISGEVNGLSITINGFDYMLFSHSAGLINYASGIVNTTLPTFAPFLDLCSSNEQLFAILDGDRNSLTYSDNCNPLEWTGQEHIIDLSGPLGSLEKLICFNDYLYVFRQYGITKLSKYGTGTSARDFVVSDVFYTTSKIYGITACQCGNDILFFASDGIYSFDGSQAKKLPLKIGSLFENINNQKPTACFHNGKYFLAIKMKFPDSVYVGCEGNNVAGDSGYENNALLVYDLHKKDLQISRGMDIRYLCAISEGNVNAVIATFYHQNKNNIGILDNDNKCFSSELGSAWLSVSSDLGYDEKMKLVKEIYLKNTHECQIVIKTDIESKTFSVPASDSYRKIRTLVKGREIQTQIYSNGINEIAPVKLKIEIMQ